MVYDWSKLYFYWGKLYVSGRDGGRPMRSSAWRLSSLWPGNRAAPLSSARLSSAQLSSAQLGSAQLGSAQRGGDAVEGPPASRCRLLKERPLIVGRETGRDRAAEEARQSGGAGCKMWEWDRMFIVQADGLSYRTEGSVTLNMRFR